MAANAGTKGRPEWTSRCCIGPLSSTCRSASNTSSELDGSKRYTSQAVSSISANSSSIEGSPLLNSITPRPIRERHSAGAVWGRRHGHRGLANEITEKVLPSLTAEDLRGALRRLAGAPTAGSSSTLSLPYGPMRLTIALMLRLHHQAESYICAERVRPHAANSSSKRFRFLQIAHVEASR
jgi:hypothetical protein